MFPSKLLILELIQSYKMVCFW